MHLIDAVGMPLKGYSKAETFSKLTVYSQLLQNYFSPAKKNHIFVYDEVRAGCPKLGHTTLSLKNYIQEEDDKARQEKRESLDYNKFLWVYR